MDGSFRVGDWRLVLPEINGPTSVMTTLHRGLEPFAFQQLDQWRGHEGGDNRDAMARSERVNPGPDERQGLLPFGEVRPDIEDYEFGGGHLEI